MIGVVSAGASVRITSSVNEFAESLGYCEYKIPFFLEGLESPPNTDIIGGYDAHLREENREKKRDFIFTSVSKRELLDAKSNLEFPREGVHTRLLRRFDLNDRRVELLLCGRTDKLRRRNETLILEEDKSSENPNSYLERQEPYPNHLLQALAYLYSKYSYVAYSHSEQWFEIAHRRKEWIIRIKDRSANDRIVRTFRGFCARKERTYFESRLETFANLILGSEEFKHHNRKEMCRPCGYFGRCKFRII